VQQSCAQWNGVYELCDKPSGAVTGTVRTPVCAYDRRSLGTCALGVYSPPLPSWANYYGDASVGGVTHSARLADYCAVPEGTI